jgi:TonB family protein
MSNLIFTGGSSLVSLVVSYAANSLWQVPLVGAAGWAASWLLRRLGPQAQHVVWVATLLLAVAMPAVPRWHWHANTGAATVTVVDDDNFVLEPMTPRSVPWWEVQNGVARLPAGFFAVMLLGYLGALVYFAGRFGWSLYWTSTLEREAAPMEFDAEREALWLRCRAACGVGAAALLRSEGIDGPVTVGFREPALLVPAGFAEECSAQELLALLAHECAHMQRRDFQKNVAYEAASLLIAFHPVTWMVKQQIAQTREMICDGMAVEKLIDAPQYMRALLRMAAQISFTMQGSTAHAIGIFDANVLEKRIITMKRKRRQVSSAVRFAMIAACAAVLAAVAMVSSARAVAVEAKAAPVVDKAVGSKGLALPVAAVNKLAAEVLGQAAGGAETAQSAAPATDAAKSARIAYANAHFSATGIQGAQSDRGRIYIAYGKPDSEDDHSANGGDGATKAVYPFQVWHYRSIKGVGDNIDVEFVDTCQCGEYRMTIDRQEKSAITGEDGKRSNETAQLIKGASASSAQGPGSLLGTLTDLEGAGLAGVRVTAKNQTTAVQSETVTNSAGQYRFNGLESGKYTLLIQLARVAVMEESGIVVTGNKDTQFDARLPGSRTQLQKVALRINESWKGPGIYPVVEAAAQTAVPDGPVQVSGGKIRGNCVFCPNPAYPPIARAAHVSGSVVLHALISKEGTVEEVKVISGPPMLAEPSMEVVRGWRYKPYMLTKKAGGVAEPTAVDSTITVNFSMANDAPSQRVQVPACDPSRDDCSITGENSAEYLYAHPNLLPQQGSAPGPNGTTGATTGLRHIGGGVSPPVLLHQVEPEYTAQARADKVNGEVVVGLYVDTDGMPTNVYVRRGIGDGLNDKAIEAVKQYRFRPAMENGKPVMVDMNVIVNFQIF